MTLLPKARTSDLVEQNLDKETLLYDLIIDKAFNLNETSTIVYKACDGKTSFEELKRKHKFTDEFIYLALDELKLNNLLAANQIYQSPFEGISRREVIKKVGLASMFVLPIVAGLVAPRAADAASNTGRFKQLEKACTLGVDTCDQPLGGNVLCTNGRCCYTGAGGIYIKGETYYETEEIIVFPVGGGCNPQDLPVCSNQCCDTNANVKVACTTENFTDEDGNIIGCRISNCACTCC